LAPVITGGDHTSIVACPVHEAMMSIAPSTLSQLPFSGRQDLHVLGTMARQVPCYRLLLGRDVRQVPVKILELLRSLEVAEEARLAARSGL
jgi:hypothetical protein